MKQDKEKKIIKRCVATIDGKEHGGVVVDQQNIIRFIDPSLIGQPRTSGNWDKVPMVGQNPLFWYVTIR
jgi:hypothetical protein